VPIKPFTPTFVLPRRGEGIGPRARAGLQHPPVAMSQISIFEGVLFLTAV